MTLDLAATRHPSDGGGRAWLEDPREAVAGQRGRWTVVYEAGPLGIAAGGRLFLQVSPFWGWSTPQVEAPEAPGYTTLSTEAEGVELRAWTADQQLLAVEIGGRELREGERVVLVYGAGPAGAYADTYAERGSRFWVAVDGDGDGMRRVLPDSPSVTVVAAAPARLILTLPSTARPGERVLLTAAVLDAAGNAGPPFEGEILLEGLGNGLEGPSRIRLGPEDEGRGSLTLTARHEGVHRLRASAAGGLSAESNPLVVGSQLARVLWGDLQIHSNLSDGTGDPEDLYRYAREVAALDVAAVTDHDHWGLLFLDSHAELWEQLRQAARLHHRPGEFVTLLGFEWTNWIHGHRHVLYPGDEGEVLGSLDERFDTPPKLWDALRGTGALTLAHHSAGNPVATNWDFPPDPELETLTEIVSVHGSSEAADAPSVVPGAFKGNFVRDALDRGYRLGFVGSGDGHDGHPGLAHLISRSGGLAAVLSEERTREGIFAALRARRTYATNGARIWLAATLDGEPMGAILAARPDRRELLVEVAAPAEISRIELVRRGREPELLHEGPGRELSLRLTVSDLSPGEYLYLRVLQRDGGAAWSSPFFIR
jgi:hypothetical protein